MQRKKTKFYNRPNKMIIRKNCRRLTFQLDEIEVKRKKEMETNDRTMGVNVYQWHHMRIQRKKKKDKKKNRTEMTKDEVKYSQ